jgi:acetyl-CoA synthetase
MKSFPPKNLESPPPAWEPSPDFIKTTNLAWLMRRVGVSSYEVLHAWSAQNREAYWELAIERLEIRLRRPFRQVGDFSRGAEQPRWLVEAQINIVESCFTAPADAPAIVEQSEGGELRAISVGELEALTDRVASSIQRLGFKPGDALAIMMPMTTESVAIYLGIIKTGAVVVGIADSFRPKEIATRLRLSHAVAVFTQDVMVRGGKVLPLYAMRSKPARLLPSCSPPPVA